MKLFLAMVLGAAVVYFSSWLVVFSLVRLGKKAGGFRPPREAGGREGFA